LQIDALLVVFALGGVLGAVVRVRRVNEGRAFPLWLLAAALIFALGSHITNALVSQPGIFAPAEMMRMAALTCAGLFGLDPATYRLLRPGPAVSETLSGGRVWFLGMAVAVIPIALGVSDLAGGRVDGALLVIGSGLVTALVMFRIRRLSTERLRAERALDHLASHDPLTGLVNRREFMAQLGSELSRDPHIVILFCDLDRFKEINDRLGHSAGDQFLVEVAKRLATSVRESDTVARLGGDEFMVLLRSVQRRDAEDVLARISEALSRPMSVNGEPVSASIGVVSAQYGDADDVIRRADQEMYRAKQSRPNHGPVRIVSGLDS
jgi:diguanylate cyclase (GGDEF)-like protein